MDSFFRNMAGETRSGQAWHHAAWPAVLGEVALGKIPRQANLGRSG